MNENDFKRQQQAAVEQMRRMNMRSSKPNTPPVPPFVKLNQPPQKKEPVQSTPEPPEPTKSSAPSFLEGLDLPFLDIFKKDGDVPLILGLLLLLMSEKADKRLLFALIYILL